jgi:hypothetical protein
VTGSVRLCLETIVLRRASSVSSAGDALVSNAPAEISDVMEGGDGGRSARFVSSETLRAQPGISA